MAQTWALHGDSSGRHYVNTSFVESIVVESLSTTGVYTLRIRMVSGQEYYAYFSSREETQAFVQAWAGETTSLDAEPVIATIGE